MDYFRQAGLTIDADFSLNVANEVAARRLRHLGARRVTPSYDLNRDQLTDLTGAVPPEWLEIVVHQHVPMFHMEHCVFCAVLSPGTDKTNCGRPCDDHRVELEDRVGAKHLLVADVGCRNTLFNAQPQSGAEIVPELLARGIRDLRVELLPGATSEATSEQLLWYGRLLRGTAKPDAVWRHLRALNRVGVTRGTLETARDPLAIL